MKKRFRKALAIFLATTIAATTYVPSIYVVEAASRMTMDKKTKTLYLNEDNKTNTSNVCDFSIKYKPAGYKTKYRFIWYVDDSSIIDVGKGGVVTALKTGKTDVKCDIIKKSTGKLFLTCKAEVTVKENATSVKINNIDEYKTRFNIDNKDNTYSCAMSVGDTFDFNRKMCTASGGKSTDCTDWISSNESVGTIDDVGLFTALSPGTTKIKVFTYQSKSYIDDPTAISGEYEISVISNEEGAGYTFDGKEADISDDFEGSGEDDNPYIIESVGQLDKLASLVNAGERFAGKYFRLDRNIDYQSNVIATPAPVSTGKPYISDPKREWKSIGSGLYTKIDSITNKSTFDAAVLKYGKVYFEEMEANYKLVTEYNTDITDYYYLAQFEGSFDGDGNKISGLYSTYDNYSGYLGFVGSLGEKGSIDNLRIEDVYFGGNDVSGGVCGQNFGSISNCNGSGKIFKGTDINIYPMGGICGINEGTGSISRCSFTDEESLVSGKYDIGGICGENKAKGKISDCYNLGVFLAEHNVGGICGNNEGEIENCYSKGGMYYQDSVEPINNGGICGANSTEAKITNCYYEKIADNYITQAVGNIDNSKIDAHAIETYDTQFLDGTLCYNLNKGILNGEQAWYQNIGSDNDSNNDSNPVLDSSHGSVCNKYEGTGEFKTIIPGYTNTIDTAYTAPDYDNNTNRYIINTISKLYWLSEQVKRGITDIDVTITENLEDNGTRSWIPIGSEDLPYTGTFDGTGKTIGKLKISDTANNQGLFGVVGRNAQIKNINISSSNMTGKDNVGGICGINDGGDITGCTISSCNIKGDNDVGGISGTNKGIIKECDVNDNSSISNVETNSLEDSTYTSEDETKSDENCISMWGNRIGGICGSNVGEVNSAIVQDCSNNAPVTGIQDVGGICGNNEGNITKCDNKGNVTGAFKTVGGVTGYSVGNVSKSYNYADISSKFFVGGICGINEGKVTNCYNAKDKTISGIKYLGGICGMNTGMLRACYNTANVSGANGKSYVDTTNDVTSAQVGSICGIINKEITDSDSEVAEVKNCYYLGGTAVCEGNGHNGVGSATQTANVDVNGETSLATEEDFKNGSIVWLMNSASEDNTSSWYQNLGEDYYPVLDNTHNMVYKGLDGNYSESKVIVTSQLEDNSSVNSIALLSVEYLSDGKATVTAEDKQGYGFLGWYNADATNTLHYTGTVLCKDLAYTFTTTQGISLVAVYKQLGNYNLKILGNNFSVNGGIKQTADYSNDYPAGTEITLKSTNPNFQYWMNENDKIISKSTTYTFTLGGNTILKPQYEQTGCVTFVSSYQQIIASKVYSENDTIEYPTAPLMLGYTFEGWDMNEKQIKDLIARNASDIKVRPIYKENETEYTVSVIKKSSAINTIGTAKTYKHLDGSAYAIIADEVEGMKFSHWSSDANGDNVISYDKICYCTFTSDKTIYAFYISSDSERWIRPVINITDKYGVIEDGEKKLVMIASRDIPDTYTVIETGTIYGRKDNLGDVNYNDVMVLNSNNASVKYMKSSLTTSKGLFVMTLRIGKSDITTNDGLMVCARGYVTIKSNTTGNIETIYSDVVQTSYNEIKR